MKLIDNADGSLTIIYGDQAKIITDPDKIKELKSLDRQIKEHVKLIEESIKTIGEYRIKY